MNTELAAKWNKLDQDDKLDIIKDAIDCWGVSEGSLFLRYYRDGSICGYIQDKPDNHLTSEVVSQATLSSLFSDDHEFEEDDAQVILDWMNSQN